MTAFSPTSARERIEIVDVLRGVALFGVFIVNFTGFSGAAVMATQAQLDALPTHAADEVAMSLIEILFAGKANTLFAFLFGLSFYLQMSRGAARGADVVPLYRRRLLVLLCFGVLHVIFIWAWDILHLYALLGFALLALRGASNRTLVVVGIVLTLVDWRIPQQVLEHVRLEDWHGFGSVYDDAAVLARQRLSATGDYWGLVAALARFNAVDYVFSGALIAWLLYAFGRFALGAWVGRRGWLQDAERFARGFKLVTATCLPLGLVLSIGDAWLLHVLRARELTLSHPVVVLMALRAVAVPVLAAGYLGGIVCASRTTLGRRVLAPFAHVGRMALTNYVAQSFVIAFVLFGVGSGLALAGQVGAALVAAITVVAYAAQVALSAWWLRRFRFGPLEWVWRRLTYGTWSQ